MVHPGELAEAQQALLRETPSRNFAQLAERAGCFTLARDSHLFLFDNTLYNLDLLERMVEGIPGLLASLDGATGVADFQSLPERSKALVRDFVARHPEHMPYAQPLPENFKLALESSYRVRVRVGDQVVSAGWLEPSSSRKPDAFYESFRAAPAGGATPQSGRLNRRTLSFDFGGQPTAVIPRLELARQALELLQERLRKAGQAWQELNALTAARLYGRDAPASGTRYYSDLAPDQREALLDQLMNPSAGPKFGSRKEAEEFLRRATIESTPNLYLSFGLIDQHGQRTTHSIQLVFGVTP